MTTIGTKEYVVETYDKRTGEFVDHIASFAQYDEAKAFGSELDGLDFYEGVRITSVECEAGFEIRIIICNLT